MNYKILTKHNDTVSLLNRLLIIRGIDEDSDLFLKASLQDYRGDPFKLNDMEKGVDIIIEAMKNNKSICIFGDYDVDGITSSYILYTVLNTYFNYKKIKITYPNRLEDGYGLKNYHIDRIKEEGHDLVITVDNGITSIEEVQYAKEQGLQIIITDHHKALDVIPKADAVINPQISEKYLFKGICGAGVAFKLINALLKKSTLSTEKQQVIMSTLLPIVAIATVADCVPLVGENRAIVKKGLEQMTRRKNLLPSLNGLLDFVNIAGAIKTYHIGFIIGPRINAGGRLSTAYDSIKTLLFTGERQIEALKNLDIINDERKKLQKEALEKCLNEINTESSILIAADSSFHQGVVGIVAGRITEQYNKPSIVLHLNTIKGTAIGSLRGPGYFDIMEMMQRVQKESQKKSKSGKGILIKFGGHKQAGGLTFDLNDLNHFQQLVEEYSSTHIKKKDVEKVIKVDSRLYPAERETSILDDIQNLEPFGIANEEPIFILENILITGKEVVGKRGNGHLKIKINHGGKDIDVLYRSKGAEIESFTEGGKCDIIGKVKYDNYKKSYYIDGIRDK